MSPWDLAAQSMQYGWAFPISPANLALGGRLHIVGNVLPVGGLLRIGVPGNNFVTLVPGPSGSIQMTQVTLGTWSFLEKGDSVFLSPAAVRPDSLIVQQLVLYKKVARNRFAR
jgi:hypothetical protein